MKLESYSLLILVVNAENLSPMFMRTHEAKDHVMSCFSIEEGTKIDHFCSETTILEKIPNGFALLSRILRKGL